MTPAPIADVLEGRERTAPLKAPFPWFGGKRRVADVAWRAFGSDVPNYIEPFAGSLAVLLGRPGGAGKIETVNDADRYLANFWRATVADPEAVARWADWPVNEADLHARHTWLVNQAEFRERMHTDPDFFDVKVAGWWVWGLCQWIGNGWCAESGERHGRLKKQRPYIGGDSVGMGVYSDTAHICKHLPSLGNDRGLHGVSSPPCADWFRALQERLRRVRVACGDWKRVLGPSVLGKGKNVGGRRPCAVFLDAPYSHEFRDPGIYAEDDPAVAALVAEWAREHGDDPDLRIALCGYEGEHDMPASWTKHAWKGTRGYAGEDNQNRHRERLWFSPHCLPLHSQGELFTEADL